jgi:hypothetical protein
MTWRYRIIRAKANFYGLHSVYVEGDGTAKYYSEEPLTFQFDDATPFEGDDQEARNHMVALLAQALADAQSAPILYIDAGGHLIEA